ncbi:MAG: hypothetical protein ACRDS0_17375 [Pseudonocardiaceae bacterium]
MALGMIVMFVPTDPMIVPGEFGEIVFGVAAVAVVGLLAADLLRGGTAGRLWMVTVVDLFAMVYMFTMMTTRLVWLTIPRRRTAAAGPGARGGRCRAPPVGRQPEEGAAGYTVNQLVTLGRALGAPGNLEPCIRSGAHDAEVKAQLAGAVNNPALSHPSANGPSFGTPTVLVDGTAIPVLTPAGSAQFDQLIS